ncbi:hypothetical protein BC939DRAFT_125259 [Gamsiella multidivaricata]|uniref:uncharacterized protein n=1 Tax=Gamsiella multidivaricata TaxID=101098 RepID=UPI00221E6531|nr:uncharacterized protein BC939DRAFT_125259 [Gamsiella multidivaricata]KAI7825728.1 hypothetical protein BC939DRAFT_125259 [Gamsiella multidivaricata]
MHTPHQHYPFFHRNHQRQYSHPQSPPGPTSTTLAQSPHRRQSKPSPATSSSTSSSAPSSPAFSLDSPPTSPQYRIDNSSNAATTLPPLPYFPPLPFPPELEDFSTVASEEVQQEQKQEEQQQQQQQQKHFQDLLLDPANSNASTNANINAQTTTTNTAKASSFSPPSTPLLPPLTGMLAAHSAGANGGSQAIPIPTRPGLYNNRSSINNSSSNNNDYNNCNNSSNTRSSGSNIRPVVNQSNSSTGIKESGFDHGIDTRIGNQNRPRRDSNGQHHHLGFQNNGQASLSVGSNSRTALVSPSSSGQGSSLKSESSYLSSRRSSKDSCGGPCAKKYYGRGGATNHWDGA